MFCFVSDLHFILFLFISCFINVEKLFEFYLFDQHQMCLAFESPVGIRGCVVRISSVTYSEDRDPNSKSFKNGT